VWSAFLERLFREVLADDPRVFPLAEAAIDMDVPIKIHTMQRTRRRPSMPNESFSENIRGLAEEYPDLKLLASHISGGGDWEHRLKNVQHLDNVYMDLSGSVSDQGIVEACAEYLGVDRLVWGSDNSLSAAVGRIEGADLTPEEKADVAYRMNELLRPDDPLRYDEEELAALKGKARERFERVHEEWEGTTTVDANAFVGDWPFRRIDASADGLLSLMDEKGVQAAAVSSANSVWYRNVHEGNEELMAAIDGHEDRLLPIATIDPTYPAWREDLEESIEEFGMRGVKLLPGYHDYDLNDPAAKDLLDAAADHGVPVILVATIEDQRQRHPRVQLRGWDENPRNPKTWSDEQIEDMVELLADAPAADVVVADGGQAYERLLEATTTEWEGDGDERPGDLYFVLGDLFQDYPNRREKILREIGVDRLVLGPTMPFMVFESYATERYLPIDDEDEAKIRGDTILDLLGE
jgi:predicted TIM-barrel fold metal-dependent hydrolase